jgi:hypothetical protein
MPNPLLEIRPTLMIKSDGVVNQHSMTALLLYNKTFWGGLGYRLADAVILQVGWIAKNNLRVGVAYEITTSDIGAYSSNSMEIMLNLLAVGEPKAQDEQKEKKFLQMRKK